MASADQNISRVELLFNSDRIDLLYDIMQKAGEAIMDIYQSSDYTTMQKSDDTPVTNADLISNEIITQNLKSLYPEIPVISEESEILPYEVRRKMEFIWLLDPLDGTKEYINKTDEFSINLALIHLGKAIAGFIYLPVFKKFYFALKGQGSYEVTSDKKEKLQCLKFSLSESELIVVTSRNEIDNHTMSYINILSKPKLIALGSALKFVSIARGDAHYYPRMASIMEWDTAAGQIIIEEAGGALVDADSGQPLVYNKASMFNPYFIAKGNTH